MDMLGITKQEKTWNFFSLLVYAALVAVVGIFFEKRGMKPEDIPVWDWIIMSLATYRLTRVMVYDRIFKFFRDFVRANDRMGLMISLKTMITCPWCAGVWAALVVFLFQYFVPYGNLLNYLLSISGVGSFILVISNLAGLKTEKAQTEIRKARIFE